MEKTLILDYDFKENQDGWFYSKKFINSLKRWNIIKSSIKGNKAVAEVVSITGNSFILKIDLYNKKIKHIGCYDINRNVSIDEIFN